jgi:hypothetical protein
MQKRYEYSFTRFYGELKDRFKDDIYAEDLRDALLLIVADFNDIVAETEEEWKRLSKEWLNEELGDGWTVEDYFKKPPELWTDNISYRIDRLDEARETAT